MNSVSPLLLIGVGTAGSSIASGVNRAFGEGLRYVLLDTDVVSGQSGGPFTLLGGERLSGRGAGGDVATGRLAAEESIKALDEHLEGVRIAVIVTALGGGTGGGGTLETAKYLVNRGIPTVVSATTPFAFEREGRGREDDGGNAALGQVLGGLERRAAAGAAAESRHDDSDADAFEVLVERPDRLFGGHPPSDDVAAGAAAGEPVAAEQREGAAGLSGDDVRVHEHVAKAFAERAVDA